MKLRTGLAWGVVLAVSLPVAAPASICGPADDTQDVELYDGARGPSKDAVNVWQAATGLLRWNVTFIPPLTPADDPGNVAGQRWCTGTLFSDRLFLTAATCVEASGGWFAPARRVGNSMVTLPPQELATLMHVSFNFQRDATTCGERTDPRTCAVRKTDDYPVVRLLELRRANLDYAILELGPGAGGELPSARYRTAVLDTSSAALAQSTGLTIIQHANGGPKRVASGTKVRITNERIWYGDIDTLAGSAGAGILDQLGRVIGLHTSGGCEGPGGENGGITLRAISQASEVIR